jgi:hypothetical protein
MAIASPKMAPSEDEALEHAFDQRRFQALGGEANWDLRRERKRGSPN